MKSSSLKHRFRAISLSPLNNLNKHGSPCNKSRIQKTSTYLNQRLFEPLSPTDPLVILEKSVSKNDMKKGTYSRSLSRKRTVKLEAIDHPIDTDMPKIINLPKLPFGKHCSYNGDEDFVKNHIIYEEAQAVDVQIAEIKKISKRILLKRKFCRKKGSPVPIMMNNTKEVEEFENEAGRLYVKVNRESCENYIKQKLKYSQPRSEDSTPKARVSQNCFSCFRNISPQESRNLDLPFMFNPGPQVSLMNKLRIFKTKLNNPQ